MHRMDPREHIRIGVYFVTYTESAAYLDLMVTNAEIVSPPTDHEKRGQMCFSDHEFMQSGK